MAEIINIINHLLSLKNKAPKNPLMTDREWSLSEKKSKEQNSACDMKPFV